MHIDEAVLAAAIGRLSQSQLNRMGLTDALQLIVGVMPGLFAVDGAGVLLLDAGQDLRHVASTDAGSQILEAVQETTGQGPCVTALVDDQVVHVRDIATDDRWPAIREVLVDNGIRGIMGVPVHIAGTPIGSLNVYHRDPHEWDASDESALLTFDQVVERLLAQAVLSARDEALVGQLERALEARIVIDRAVGMLMGLADLDAAESFERIRRSARSSRRRVADVAGEMLTTRKLP